MEKLSFDTIVKLKTVECPDPLVVTIKKTGKKVKLLRNDDEAELEILSKPECWWKILSGQLSPVEAFLTHRLRVRGNVEVAKKILLEIGEPKGIVDPCNNDNKWR
jgi:putative sterol carrier protein